MSHQARVLRQRGLVLSAMGAFPFVARAKLKLTKQGNCKPALEVPRNQYGSEMRRGCLGSARLTSRVPG